MKMASILGGFKCHASPLLKSTQVEVSRCVGSWTLPLKREKTWWMVDLRCEVLRRYSNFTVTHGIHGTGILTYISLIFMLNVVYKYSTWILSVKNTDSLKL